MVSGIVWVLRTGAPRRDVPERFGKWTTIHSRFRPWTAQGILQKVWAELQRQADLKGQLDWSMHFVGGTVVRAHQCVAGAGCWRAMTCDRQGFTGCHGKSHRFQECPNP
ncbi:transposase [Deinococcus hopiensis]|uniref:transposase n=1 Tax=Deinococcus hopiensis TaxID=309885 RepID=UPI003CCC0117